MNNKMDFTLYTSSDEEFEDAMVAVPILMECDKDEDFSEGMDKVGDVIPILPLRNMILFPGVAMPVVAGRNKSMRLVKDAVKKKIPVGVYCQKEPDVDDPGIDDLYNIGTISEIMRVLEMPDGSTTVILQGKKRCSIKSVVKTEPYLAGKVEQIDEIIPKGGADKEYEALSSSIKELVLKMLSASFDPPRDLIFSIRNNQNTLYLINFACCNMVPSAIERQELLNISSLKERGYRLLVILNRESQLIDLKASIQMKTHEDINKEQKEYFLKQQIKAIQKELGDNISEIAISDFREKAKTRKWSKEIGETVEKEISKLERLHPQSPDHQVQMEYVQTIMNLPWGEYSRDNFNLKRAEKILNRDHYGMEKVKERIIEHLAVLKLKRNLRSPIICLYGPPGVGKTSLAKSIAEALSRKYVRMSLGGLHDEAEIRGHRRTYIGAMMGRVMDSIRKAGTSNPVFVLDEIDKVGNDFKGDPASALLEVLDPEQNEKFHDNYLDIDYDLSRVMFLATANSLNSISQPLLDRMELIEVGGYIAEEKIQIALKHLVPKQTEAHGVAGNRIKFTKEALRLIIDSYTHESGVRELDKKIAKIMRKIAKKIASDDKYQAETGAAQVREYLGVEEYTPDKYQGNGYAGVVTGLAWTALGGEILFVETSLSESKNARLTVTGNLGDVMKESAVIALEYVRSHASAYGVGAKMFDKYNVHIHVPEGAIPKDGPSAGITMVTSLVSAFTNRKVRSCLAMTGEMTLRGKVLPVGGIREKILAAKRAGITTIVLSEENRKDVGEIKKDYLEGLTFRFVKDIQEVIDFALLDETVG